MTMGVEKHMEKNKKGPAGDLVDQWNWASVPLELSSIHIALTFVTFSHLQNFFNARGIQITLAKGSVCYSGQSNGPPPDLLTEDEYADHYDHGGHSSSLLGRRREGRRERKQHKRQEKEAKDELWRLVVSSVAPGYKAAVF